MSSSFLDVLKTAQEHTIFREGITHYDATVEKQNVVQMGSLHVFKTVHSGNGFGSFIILV